MNIKILMSDFLHMIFNSRPQKKEIQVKLTEPVTAILYITYDKQHMEDLRHALHLKSIVDGLCQFRKQSKKLMVNIQNY